jgi:hypothetical protein
MPILVELLGKAMSENSELLQTSAQADLCRASGLKLVPFVRHTAVDVTPLFSLRENAIAKEPGLRYPERWPCVSRLGCSNGGSASFEASPYVTLSRGAFSAPSLVTPIR